MLSEKERRYYLKKLEVSEITWDNSWDEIEKKYRNESRNFNKYTLNQRKAIHSIDGDYLMIGGAGTGRTSTLIFRMRIMKEVYKIDLSSILVLTYSKKVAKEFKIKAQNEMINPKEFSISTFYSLTANLLKVGEEFFISQILPQYKYIIIDEYEELNSSEIKILQLFSKAGVSFFCTGDINQSITNFSRLSSEGIELFKRDFPMGKFIYLEKNFRSVRGIDRFIKNIEATLFKNKMKIGRKDRVEISADIITPTVSEGKPLIVKVKTLEEEGEYIALSIKKTLELKKGRVGIFCRDRSYFGHIEKALKKYDIEYIDNLKKYTISSEEKFLHIYDFFRSSSEKTLKKLRKNIKESKNEKELEDKDILEEILNRESKGHVHSNINLLKNTKYERIKEYYWRYKELNLELSDKIDLLKEKKIELFLALYRELYLEDISLEESLKRIESYFSNEKELSIKPAIMYGMSSNIEKSKNIYVEVVDTYSLKGSEWDCLFIPTALDKVYRPGIQREISDLEYERRVFYTGCSRARSKLIITYPKYSLLSYRESYERSRFLDEIDKKLWEFKDLSFI